MYSDNSLVSHLDIWPTEALSSNDIALIVVGTARVAVASLAAQWVRLRQSVVLRQTLITVPHPGYISLALTLSGLLVTTSATVHGTQGAACT